MNRLNNKGFSIAEMLATIVVASIVTMILMQLLVMSVRARTTLQYENRMLDESYYIAEEIRGKIFELEPQEIELIEDTATQTVIEIRHLYDFTTNAQNEIVQDFSNPVTDTLVFDKVNERILYNGEQLNDPNIFITTGTLIELVSIEPAVCDLGATACDQGILKLTLSISIQLADGTRLTEQIYISTILV